MSAGSQYYIDDIPENTRHSPNAASMLGDGGPTVKQHRVNVSCLLGITTELEQWNANIAFAQVNFSPLADHKPGNWLFPV